MRWTAARKLEVIQRHRAGELTQAELDEWLITAEELASWARAYDRDGLEGLKTTKLQEHRTPVARRLNGPDGRAPGGAVRRRPPRHRNR